MAKRRNDNTPGDAHALTFSCYKRLKLSKSERMCQWFLESLLKAREQHQFSLWAYVIMPEHVHLLVFPRTTSCDIAEIRHEIKSPFARRAIEYVASNHTDWLPNLTRTRGQRTECLFWQSGGGYDRNVREATTMESMIDYIHMNPVRRGFVERARDWRWSSAAAYEGGSSPLMPDAVDACWMDGTG